MFKNALIYTFTGQPSLLVAEEGMQAFEPCAPSQDKATGWASPRGLENSPLIESVGNQWIAKFIIETKSVPGSLVKRHLDDRIAKIEQEQGRKPGRKESRELREDIVRDLLPSAFPKTAAVWVWIDRSRSRIVLDTSSQNKADEVITALVRAFDGITIAPLNTQKLPQMCMTAWLQDSDTAPECFVLGRHVELKSYDEMKSVVKFDRHHLDDEQMRLHIGQGKLPVKLALEWEGRVSFVLTEGMALRKIAFMDGAMESRDDDADAFDADVAIATGELGPLIHGLEDVLGGQLK